MIMMIMIITGKKKSVTRESNCAFCLDFTNTIESRLLETTPVEFCNVMIFKKDSRGYQRLKI